MPILDQRHTNRLHITKDPPATGDGLVEVGSGLLELGHRDRARDVDSFAFPPQQPGRVVDLVGSRDDEQDRVRGPQPRPHLANEIRVAGSVEQINLKIAARDRCGAERLRRRGLAAYVSSRRTRGYQCLKKRALAGTRRSHEHYVADMFWRLRTVLAARIGSIAHASPFPITPLRKSRAAASQYASPNSPRARPSHPTMHP